MNKIDKIPDRILLAAWIAFLIIIIVVLLSLTF